MKEIYIDGELEMVDTTNWFPKVLRKDFTVGMVVSENGLDDPDQNFYENYACGAAPLPSTDGTLQLRDRWFAGLSAGGSRIRTVGPALRRVAARGLNAPPHLALSTRWRRLSAACTLLSRVKALLRASKARR